MTNKSIYEKLIPVIGNPYGVCGLMGNLKAESGMKSTNIQNSYEKRLGMNDASYTQSVDNGTYQKFASDSVGYGYAQWTSSGRKARLLSFAKQRGVSIGNDEMQIDFVIYELNGSYKSVLNALKKASSVREASDIVCKKYERPADQSEAVLVNRASYGQEFYNELVQKTNNNEKEQVNLIMSEKIVVYAYSKRKEGNVKLSANFKVKEFACKDGSDVVFVAPELVEILQKIRTHFGKAVVINSAYRTPSHNKKEGGATYSQHLYGTATDIRISGVKPKDVAKYVETLMPDTGGIGIYSNFVHIDVRRTKSRWNG